MAPSVLDYRPLRLKAADEEDLSAVSSVLQDAIAKLGDFAFLPERRQFAFVANRFVWECAGDARAGSFARVRTGVHFDDVKSVRRRYLRTDARDAVVELLAIHFEPGDDGEGVVILDFAGGGAVQLNVEALSVRLTDLGAPWPTRSRPHHKDA
ncbi:MAG: DUF2948 family protein [Pseudomonadota bacterium]